MYFPLPNGRSNPLTTLPIDRQTDRRTLCLPAVVHAAMNSDELKRGSHPRPPPPPRRCLYPVLTGSYPSKLPYNRVRNQNIPVYLFLLYKCSDTLHIAGTTDEGDRLRRSWDLPGPAPALPRGRRGLRPAARQGYGPV